MPKFFLFIIFSTCCIFGYAQNISVDFGLLKKADEEIIFSFRIQHNNKIALLCKQKDGKYLVYRFGTKDKIELEYPSAPNFSSWQQFGYAAYNQHEEKKQTSAKGVYVISFVNKDATYKLYEDQLNGDVGLLVEINKKEINLKGNIHSVIGTLSKLENEQGINNKNISDSLTSIDINTVINNDKTSNWKGEWTRKEWQNDANLTIKKVHYDSVYFDLSASSGGNMGEVEGTAILKGNKATFFSNENDDSCLLEFEIFSDSLIEVSQINGLCFAGMGVEYTGDYYNSKFKMKAKKEVDLQTIELLDSTDNIILKKLVGKEYDQFVSSTQLTDDDDSDLDGLNAKVYASGVRGLYTEMENIIMVAPGKSIWAAVIDDEKVYYYTNRENYKHKLPKTIENWRKNFKQYPVFYKSAN